MDANVFSATKLRMPALLFVSSLIGFVLLMIVVIGLVLPSLPNGIGGLTPHQMSSFLEEYLLIQAFPLVPILFGVIGVALPQSTILADEAMLLTTRTVTKTATIKSK